MLRLTGSDLPTSGTGEIRTAPLLRLYNGDRHPLAPFLNLSLSRSNTAYNPIVLNLGEPGQLGSYYQFTTGFNLAGIIRLVGPTGNFDETNPLSTIPGKYWRNGNTLNVHAGLGLKAGDTVTAIAIAKAALPAPDGDDNYSIAIGDWGNPSIAEIVVEGLQFLPAQNPGNPQTSDFVVSGSTLKLYGSSAVRPAAGSEVLILLTISFAVAERVCAIATFNLDMNYLDAIDYLGIAFTPAVDALSPQPKEFFWANGKASLFIPNGVAIGLGDRATGQEGYSSAIGEITYQGRV